MSLISPSSFASKILPPLDALAGEVLRLKQYHRLHKISEFLDVFSSGQWDQQEDEIKRRFIKKMQTDFHVRAWDDWSWTDQSAYSELTSLIADEARALDGKQE